MERTTLIIECDRAAAEDVIAELRRFDDTIVTVQNDAKKLSGLVDALSIVASLTAVAQTAFTLWLQHRKDKNAIKVRATEDETAENERT
jgi:ABC-type hemin transport system substrate-binding protein